MREKERAELLAACLEDLETGRATLEQCRARLAAHGGGLSLLLELARHLGSVQHPQVSSAPLLQARTELAARKQPGQMHPARHVAWVLATTALALLLVAMGTVLASANSLPGQPLYTVKRGVERVQIALTVQPGARSSLLMSFAERRLDEVALLCPQAECPQALLADLEGQTRGAVSEIDRLPAGNRAVLLERLVALTTRQQEVLRQVLVSAPASTRPELQTALDQSRQDYEQACLALEKEKEAHPTPPVATKERHTPGPGQTGKPTRTSEPEPTRTPKPTDTSRPTDTPKPTHTPRPTDAPKPTHTPKPTDAPRPTDTPRPAKTPKPTDTPKPTKTPKP